MEIVLILALLARISSSIPILEFPINAQVPPVARVAQYFSFQFASTTFSSSTNITTLQYDLGAGVPSWLHLHSATRILYGIPEASDLGPSHFDLIASDDTGQIITEATLIVIDSSIPVFSGNVTSELAQHGRLSGPSTLGLQTGSSFAISFSSMISANIVNPFYYATCGDRSPLPSWIIFDPASVSFSGMTPPLLSSPQLFEFELIMSRVEGFEEASLGFGFEISKHQLVFEPLEQRVQVTPDLKVDIASLRDHLYLDGQGIGPSDLVSAHAQCPQWLAFDPLTLSLSGEVPSNLTSRQLVTISATDVYGDEATALIILELENDLIVGHIGNITAVIGSYFSFSLSRSMFITPNVTVTMEIDSSYAWLSFDSTNLTLHGSVPSNARPGALQAVIHVQSTTSLATATHSFQITIERPISSLNVIATRTSPTMSASTASPYASTTAKSSRESHTGPSKGIQAAVGIVSAGAALLLLAIFTLCLRRRRRGRRPGTPDRSVWPRRSTGCFGHDQEGLEKTGRYLGTPEIHPTSDRAPRLEDEVLGLWSNVPSSIGRQSGGTVLQPADEVTLKIMNRSSLGLDGLGIHVSHNSTKLRGQGLRRDSESLPIRPKHLSRLTADQISLSTSNRGSNWFGAKQELQSIMQKTRRQSLRISDSKQSRDSEMLRYPLAAPEPLLVAKTKHDDASRAWIRCVSQISNDVVGVDSRPLAVRRQSYIRRRASSAQGNPLFAANEARKSSVGRRTPLGLRSSNSRRLAQRSQFTRSKSSSVGVATGRSSRVRISAPLSERWETESSNYSDRASEDSDEDEVVMDSGMGKNIREEIEERETRRSKLARRLGRNSRGDFLESITERNAVDSQVRRSRLTRGQTTSPLRLSNEFGFVSGNRHISGQTNASSTLGGAVFI